MSERIKELAEQAELLKWRLKSAKMRFDAWRTEQASNRNLERMTK